MSAFVLVVSTLATLLATAAALPAHAQDVYYQGRLQIGWNDADNVTGFALNAAVPRCAGGGPLVNTGTIGTTLGTLLFNGKGQGAPGVGGALTFHAVSPLNGGAQEKRPATCRHAMPALENPRLRSRTFIASAHFPGRKGDFTSMISSAAVPLSPAATYMLSIGGGNTQAAPHVSWTTMATGSAPPVTYSGPAISSTFPIFGAGHGVDRIQPGANRFGGGIPYSGASHVQLGIQLTTFAPITVPYGVFPYANGRLPAGPQFFGTDAKGYNVLSPITTPIASPPPSVSLGLIAGRHDFTFAARTPGGSTIGQQGAIRTLAGGNTVTPHTSCPDPMTPCALPIVSPVAFEAALFEWTTGSVTHTDRVGSFTTIRRAAGYDVAVAPSSSVVGETRRIQVVSPWSASIRPIGPFGLPIPTLAYGGIAILTINVIPYNQDSDMSDLDLVVDGVDNCQLVANGPGNENNQIDTDKDGFGNACDSDYNNDGHSTTLDFQIWLASFVGLTPTLDTDHNGDSVTTTLDFALFLRDFQAAFEPGPSGLTCAGLTVPCVP